MHQKLQLAYKSCCNSHNIFSTTRTSTSKPKGQLVMAMNLLIFTRFGIKSYFRFSQHQLGKFMNVWAVLHVIATPILLIWCQMCTATACWRVLYCFFRISILHFQNCNWWKAYHRRHMLLPCEWWRNGGCEIQHILWGNHQNDINKQRGKSSYDTNSMINLKLQVKLTRIESTAWKVNNSIHLSTAHTCKSNFTG